MQEHIPEIVADCELLDFSRHNGFYNLSMSHAGRLRRIKAKNLVLATGGYAGVFERTNNVRYNSYNVFSMAQYNGASVANLDCVFKHPFGYEDGKRILLGPMVKHGSFVDNSGNHVFDEETRALLRTNSYHEVFHELVRQIEEHNENGPHVFFISPHRGLLIEPTVHYTSGGIVTDHIGRVAGCKDLYAIGECQANGSRNQGRFPGYPFTAAIVQATALAEVLLQ